MWVKGTIAQSWLPNFIRSWISLPNAGGFRKEVSLISTGIFRHKPTMKQAFKATPGRRDLSKYIYKISQSIPGNKTYEKSIA